MSKILKRLELKPHSYVIVFGEEEKKFFKGSGFAIVVFRKGKMIDLFHPLSIANAPGESEIPRLLMEANRFVESNQKEDDEVWGGFCSCYELCDPFLITMDSGTTLAKITKIIRSELSSFF